MTWTRVAPRVTLPTGRGVRVDVAGHRIALFNLDEGVFAIGDRCSHAEAALSEGFVWGTVVECPRHGAEFDVTNGNVLSLPATKPVPSYPTKVDDGVVYLDIPEETP